jgi:AcrR family transcriptional regulator
LASKDRRPEILAATCTVIAREGIHDTYIRHVAEEAGVSRALVSYYYPTRDELLMAALEFAETRAIDEIDERTGSRLPTIARLTEMLMLEFDEAPAVRENWLIWSELTESALYNDALKDTLEKWSKKWDDAVAQVIEAGQEEGSISKNVNAQDAAERLTALVDGLGVRWLLGEISQKRARELVRGSVSRELA